MILQKRYFLPVLSRRMFRLRFIFSKCFDCALDNDYRKIFINFYGYIAIQISSSYIDPDGTKREYTYVSGNPCDEEEAEANEADLDEFDPDGMSDLFRNFTVWEKQCPWCGVSFCSNSLIK